MSLSGEELSARTKTPVTLPVKGQKAFFWLTLEDSWHQRQNLIFFIVLEIKILKIAFIFLSSGGYSPSYVYRLVSELYHADDYYL